MGCDEAFRRVERRQRAGAPLGGCLEEVPHQLLDPPDGKSVATTRAPVLLRFPPDQDVERLRVAVLELEAAFSEIAFQLPLFRERRFEDLLRGALPLGDVCLITA
jgi:hypothetical protein